MTPCPQHPTTPLTHLGCCECHGLALAEKDKGARPNWHRSKKTAEPEREPEARTYTTPELLAMVRARP